MPRIEAQNTPVALEEIALENAVEGCVRETFGALLATLPGCDCDKDPAIRAAMARIARRRDSGTQRLLGEWQVG